MINKYLQQSQFQDFQDFQENFKLIVPQHFNFAYDIVDQWAETHPNKRALLWTNDKGEYQEFSFLDLKLKSDKAASFFQQLGLKRGDIVMAILKRRYEFWITILALHKIGITIVPATHLLTKKDIVYRNNAANITAIISVNDNSIIDYIEESKEESPSLKYLISVGTVLKDGWVDFHQGIENAPPFVPTREINSNSDPMIISFTSGTTGNPKMVVLDYLYPLGHIVTAKYWHNLNENSLHLTIADTGWLKAVWGKLYGQWIVGATVFVYDHEVFNPMDILKMIEKHRITSLCAPPTIFRFLIREDLSLYNLSSLEYCTIAGEALNPEVYNQFYNQTGIKLREGYGQSETTLTVFTPPFIEPKSGSMGLPNPQYDVDILTADGRSAEVGEEGQIILYTHKNYPVGLFKGYYRNEELTNEVFNNNIYYTGDVAWRDEDGYYWFVGRADDVIKSSGYRIGPFEVESALMTHPAVVECAVTGVPDELRGQVVKATIVLAKDYKHRDKEELAKEIQTHVKKVTAPYKYPRIIDFVEDLPKTISGKIRRTEIRKKDK